MRRGGPDGAGILWNFVRVIRAKRGSIYAALTIAATSLAVEYPRSSRTAEGDVSLGAKAVGAGVRSAVGNGDGDPFGGTGVGGGVEATPVLEEVAVTSEAIARVAATNALSAALGTAAGSAVRDR